MCVCVCVCVSVCLSVCMCVHQCVLWHVLKQFHSPTIAGSVALTTVAVSTMWITTHARQHGRGQQWRTCATLSSGSSRSPATCRRGVSNTSSGSSTPPLAIPLLLLATPLQATPLLLLLLAVNSRMTGWGTWMRNGVSGEE